MRRAFFALYVPFLVCALFSPSASLAAARSVPFAPGETIDPGAGGSPCGPTDANCFPGSVSVSDEGTQLSASVLHLDFVGTGVTATQSGATTTITIPGGTGLTSLNGDTTAIQTFATGSSGSDFNISTASGVHTFNIPDASATARGLVTTGTQTIAGNKTFTGSMSANTLSIGTLSGVLYGTSGSVGTVATSGLNVALADTTGTLAASRGGTGWANILPGVVLLGNGTGSLATTTRADLLAGTGISLSGSGTNAILGAGATLSLDINGLTTKTSVNNTDDFIAVYDNTIPGIRKITRANFLQGLTSALQYQGTWNANTNIPTLADGSGSSGQAYVASVGGTVDLGSGSLTVNAGDFVIHNGTKWQVAPSGSNVSSVFGRTGAVATSTGDYTASDVAFAPTGTISSTNTQAAIAELMNEKITSLGGLTATTQSFANDTNVTISSSGSTHTLGWTGQLAVSRGGTGLGTVSANQLLVGNTGGTGWTQVATSGLNIALSDTAGTLAVARGGTGATTLTGLVQGNGTGALTAVGGTTGQIPYFSSTNALGATSALYVGSAGKIGIGTTNPGGTLDVTGTASTIVTREFSASPTAPQSAIQIGLGGTASDGNGIGPSFLFFANNSASQKEYLGRLTAVWENSTDGAEAGAILFSTRANAADTTANTERMRITAAGDVGIGTTTPDGKLVVNEGSAGIAAGGALTAEGTAEPGIRLRNYGYNTYDIFSGGGGASTYNNKFAIYDRTNNASRLVIDNSGNVGIGTTSPSAMFTDYGDLFLEGANRYLSFGTAAGSPGYGFRDNAGNLEFKNSGGAWTRVGAGTFSWTPTTNFGAATNATTTPIWLQNGLQASSTSQFAAANVYGNFGIGTTSPWAKLAVWGSNTTSGSWAFSVANSASTTNFAIDNAGFISAGASQTGTPSGVFTVDAASGTTTASNLVVGNISFDTNAGVVNLSDIPIDSNAASGVLMEQNIALGGLPVLSVYGEANGSGSIQNTRVGVGTTSPWRTFSVSGTVAFSGLGTVSGTNSSLCLSASGQVIYNNNSDSCASSLRDTKHDINTLNLDALGMVQALKPVSFIYNNDASSTVRYGFIAEDSAAIDPHFGSYDSTGALSGIEDRSFIAIAIKALQQLIAKVEHFAEQFTTKKLCVEKSDGTPVCMTGDQLAAVLASVGQTPSAPSISTGSADAAGTSGAPQVAVSGKNPAEVDVGDVYSDLGAAITGPQDALNLGISAIVDGGATTTLDRIIIDTSTARTHTIRYVVVNADGIIGSASRMVNVVEPNGAGTHAASESNTVNNSAGTPAEGSTSEHTDSTNDSGTSTAADESVSASTTQ